jgi:transcriptional regulator with XRE-family HTH domain
VAMADETRNPASALATRIEELRRERGMTVENLVELAEVDRSTLRALAGGADIGIFSIVRIAGALEVELDELVGKLRAEDPGCD